MGDAVAQYKQKISNDAVLKQPTYAHDKEVTWATFLLEREDLWRGSWRTVKRTVEDPQDQRGSTTELQLVLQT